MSDIDRRSELARTAGRRPILDVHVGDGTQRTLHDDVLDGLTRPSKELPPKHL